MKTNSQKTKCRVVVTGMGAVSPVGDNLTSTWNGIIEGRVTARHVTKFDASQMPTKIAYEIDQFKFDESLVKPEELAFLSDFSKFGVQAGYEAIEQAKLLSLVSNIDKNRWYVCLGNGMGSPDFEWYCRAMVEKNYDLSLAGEITRHFPNVLSSVLGRVIKAQGGCFTVHTACASSGQSLGEAFELIQSGAADVVLTGGADSMINPFHMAGFCLLGAMSRRNDVPKAASRPFDEGRDGFVLGEGACTLVFEEYTHAVNRGATILGEVVGYGVTESAYRITDLHPEGDGPLQAMQFALNDASIAPHDLGYINAHGTSTLLNDRIEALAINRLLGKKSHTYVSSTKSVTGHMISAAGAMELAVCLQALRYQVLPPSVNLKNQDQQCAIKLTTNEPSSHRFDYALSNSVGFGGSNTALVVRRAS